MTILKLLRTFTISDAVEGAVEVRMELADALREYRPRSRLLLLGLTIGVLLLVAATVINVYWLAIETMNVLYGDRTFDLTFIGLSLAYVFLTVIALAVGGTVLIFVVQMRRFFSVLRVRYGTLEGPGMGSTKGPSGKVEDEELLEEAKGLTDPARTLLGLAKEAELEVSQLDDLWKASVVFTTLMAFISLGAAGLAALGDTFAPSSWHPLLVSLYLLAALLLFISVLLLVEAGRFVRYFVSRVRALEVFEDEGVMPVPPGDDTLDRLEYCLVGRGYAEAESRSAEALEGSSGKRHAFDMVLGGPGERVLVRTYEGTPGIDDLRGLRRSAKDVARREGALPLRIVALVSEDLDDLDIDDVVYDYLMEHPILDDEGERTRSLQIVAEVEGYYSVLPFTVP